MGKHFFFIFQLLMKNTGHKFIQSAIHDSWIVTSWAKCWNLFKKSVLHKTVYIYIILLSFSFFKIFEFGAGGNFLCQCVGSPSVDRQFSAIPNPTLLSGSNVTFFSYLRVICFHLSPHYMMVLKLWSFLPSPLVCSPKIYIRAASLH